MDQAVNFAHRTQVAAVCGRCGRCGRHSAFCHAQAPGEDAQAAAVSRALDDGWRVLSLRYAVRLAALPAGAVIQAPTDPWWHCPACAALFHERLRAPQLSDRKATP